MLTYLRQLYTEAKGKVTTYLALAVGGVSQLADHAQELHDQFPELKGYLPQGPAIEHGAHYALSGLGLLIVWSRVRRLLGAAKPAT